MSANDQWELEWWRVEFASRFPAEHPLPRVGSALLGRTFKIQVLGPDGEWTDYQQES